MRKPRVQLTCGVCAGVFELLPCQLGRGRGQFCSKACSAVGHRNRSVLQCALCDSEFSRAIAEQDIGEKVNQFCSRACYFEWRALCRKSTTYVKDGARHAHRVVAEEWLGRALTSDETVHHMDLNKHNPAPENLAVFPNQSLHMLCHHGKIPAFELADYLLVNMTRAAAEHTA